MKKLNYLIFAAFALMACNNTPVALPTVTTGDAQLFTETQTATCDGNVTNDGGGKVTERGICYVQGNAVPDINNTHVASGTGTGLFYCSLTNLSNGTWSYRAYAVNEAGTAYGEAKTFTFGNGSVTPENPQNPENPDKPENPDNPENPGNPEKQELVVNKNVTLDDFLGTWSVKEDIYSGTDSGWEPLSYQSAVVKAYNDGWIEIYGLYGDLSKVKDSFTAWGIWDDTEKCIRIFGGLYSEKPMYIADTAYYAIFSPLYLTDFETMQGYFIGLTNEGFIDDSDAIIENGDTLGWGEARLVMNMDNQIVYTSGKNPSSRGYYANSAYWFIVNETTWAVYTAVMARNIVLTGRTAPASTPHKSRILHKSLQSMPNPLKHNHYETSLIPQRIGYPADALKLR
ncbi:MAG: hypothetical protein IJ776_06810 [Paludibacteraceae bacterium]|nr:hypothetical protein [Paludibacteraceae bacterium]